MPNCLPRLAAISILVIFSLSISTTLSAQSTTEFQIDPQAVGGEFRVANTECLSDAKRSEILKDVQDSVNALRAEGKLAPESPMFLPPAFSFPVMGINGSASDFGVHGISNFVDQNPGFPNQILDYNCGSRSYDTAAGYNHKGVDIFTWPFTWNKMDNSEVAIIAAEAGTIVFKSDGNFDRSCSSNNNNWNAVYVQHADGTISWYGHMKLNSQTAKPVGASVARGEYLGIVGSSGNSTGPHLHFEIYAPGNLLRDPYQGSCNSMNAESYWQSQPAYRDSKINRLMTHSAPPVFSTCPSPEVQNKKDSFLPGDTAYFAAYYRDQIAGEQTDYSLIRPDGFAASNWSHVSPQTYNASSWRWQLNMPTNTMPGTWIFRAVYKGQTYEKVFEVRSLSEPFDYDGDHKADISVYRPSGGSWWIRNSLNGSMYALDWGSGADRMAPADYDGDGQTDVAIFRPGTGQWWVLNSQTMTLTVHEWGIATDVVAPGDYTGDGKADYVVWRPSDGGWYIKGSDGVDSATSWGIATDKPVAADYDGDGKMDLGIFRPAEGNWWIRSSQTLGTIVKNLGIGTDKLVPADYTGDGKADVAVWRPADGGWWYLDSTTGAAVVRQWGIPTDIPAPADYDGNGKTDLAVFRPAEGNWWIYYDNNTTTAIGWGTNGDQPTPNAFVR